ncbi:MAG TPA: hypothetical protein DCS60_02515 [Opitutae bacterium]|nr:hypothetical protein [Opitutae bacterium]
MRFYKDGQILFTETIDTTVWECRQFMIWIEPGVSSSVFKTDEPSVVTAAETLGLRFCILSKNTNFSEENGETSVF